LRHCQKPTDVNIAAYIAANARYRADKHAIVDSRESLTYAALDDRVKRIATVLARAGVGPGDLVGAALFDSVDLPAIWLAVARLGGVNLPMDWRWTAAEQRRANETFKPKLVLGEASRKFDPGLPLVVYDDAWRATVAAAPPLDVMASDIDAPFILALSSGTTGAPQGAVYPHRNYFNMISAYWADIGIGPDDRYLSVLPIAFAAGRGIAMANLVRGATVHLMPPLYEPAELLQAIGRWSIDTISVVPSIARMLLAESKDGEMLLPNIRRFVTVGAMLFPEENQAIRTRLTPGLVDYYGSAGGGMNTVMLPAEFDLKQGSVGRPMLGSIVEIVDEDDRPVSTGETGRLRCISTGMAIGLYPPDPDSTAFRNGWHYPGDYAYIDSDGYVFLQGRWNDVIIRGGMNIFAPEVERTLLTCAGVREAAVVGMKSAKLGEEPAAFVVTDGTTDERAILRHCRSLMVAYKVPSVIRVIDALPRNSTGKVVKADLIAQLPG
jgi:acyl-coenzyme A synthetase/AMP-(fatty) acid ligase